MILVIGQFLGMFGCSLNSVQASPLPIVGENSLGACDRLTQSVFRRFEKKSYKTLTLMSSAFSPCLTATKVSIADGPFESKLSSQALILTLTRGGEVHKWTED